MMQVFKSHWGRIMHKKILILCLKRSYYKVTCIMRSYFIIKKRVWVCVYANMINMFIVIISRWWDYGDNYYFLCAGLNFL